MEFMGHTPLYYRDTPHFRSYSPKMTMTQEVLAMFALAGNTTMQSFNKAKK
jgi:hypothetical protein